MAPIELPYLASDVDRHGNVRWYVRMPGQRKVRIRDAPGTEAFLTAYWAVRNGEVRPAAPKLRPARPGTFRYIAQHYYQSAAFKDLDRTYTQRERRAIIDPLIEKIGDHPAVITPARIREAVSARTLSAGRKFVAALRHVYGVAIADGLVTEDPTVGIRTRKPKTPGFHSWTLAECLAYEARWPLGTKQRTAYAIGLYLACRRSDAVLLGRAHVSGDRVVYTQQKNRNRSPVTVRQPIVPPLREALDAWQGKSLQWLQTDYGDPYTAAGFGNAFGDWCAAAGIPHCSFHGLRKATAARLAELGASANQIKAVLGDKTLQQADVYTRAADAQRMASDALTGLYGERIVPPVRSGGTKIRKIR